MSFYSYLYLMDESLVSSLNKSAEKHESIIDLVKNNGELVLEFGNGSKLLEGIEYKTSAIFDDSHRLIQDESLEIINDSTLFFQFLIDTMREGIIDKFRSAFNDPESAKSQARIKLSRWTSFPPLSSDTTMIVDSSDWEYLIFRISYIYNNYLKLPEGQSKVLVLAGY